jgi:hypothetical protein
VTVRSVVTGRAIPGASGVTLLARLRGQGGALVTQASLTSIAWTATDLTTGFILGTGTASPALCVFDALQLDPRWTLDSPGLPGSDGSAGYNFALALPATLFPVRVPALAPAPWVSAPLGDRYQADVVLTPVVGQPFRVSWRWSESVVYG